MCAGLHQVHTPRGTKRPQNKLEEGVLCSIFRARKEVLGKVESETGFDG